MIEFLFTALFAIVATGLGWSVVQRLDPANRLLDGERLGVAFLIGCLGIYFGVQFIGPWRLDGLTMGGLAGGAALLSLPGLKAMPWRDFSAAVSAEKASCGGDRWLALLWLVAAAIGLATLLQGLAPPNDYDSLMYHLALPRYDIELGRMDIAWGRRIFQILMPAFGGNLSRFALALTGDGAAQMIHALFGLIAALGSAMLALRLGCGKATALLAAIMFLSVRAVVWEMASAETDVLLAAAAIMFLLVYLEWRKEPAAGLGVLFGALVGITILIKLHGFVLAAAIAPLIIFDMVRSPRSIARGLIGPAVTLAVIAPHLIRTYLLSGNPLFPMFNKFFSPDSPDFLSGFSSTYGTGQGILDLLLSPWTASVMPMHYYDGMVLGAPYLLALAPMILLAPDKKRWLPVLSMLAVYYVIWFYELSQQVRFLLHVAPLLAVMAAAGSYHLWSRTRQTVVLKWSFIAVAALLFVNQSAFVGIYAALRLPSALGIVSDAAYHEKTPTMTGANFKTCGYIAENLRPGETYFSDLGAFISYYCPQVAVVSEVFPEESRNWLTAEKERAFTQEEFTKRVEEAGFRFFMTRKEYESRRNVSGESVIAKSSASTSRFGIYLLPVYEKLTPLVEGPFTAVYDGAEVTRLLRESSRNVP